MAGRRGLFIRKDATAGTSPQGARLALAGLVTPDGDLGVLPGVHSGCVVTGNAAWVYTVSAGHFQTTRGSSDGVAVAALDGPTDTSAVAAAPATGSRWDLVWVRQRDVDQGDADSGAVVGVTSGSSSGSPSKPYGSVPAGAYVVAEAQVFAGATQTSHANVTITQVARRVAARGGIVPATATQRALITGDASNPVWSDDGGNLWRHAGGAATQGLWAPHTPTTFAAAGGAPAVGQFGPGFTSLSLSSGVYSQPVTYHRDPAGYVNLAGVVTTTGPVANGSVIAWLPTGFRPSATYDTNGRRRYAAPYGGPGVVGKIEVFGNGQIIADTGTGGGDTISLDGIRFKALG